MRAILLGCLFGSLAFANVIPLSGYRGLVFDADGFLLQQATYDDAGAMNIQNLDSLFTITSANNTVSVDFVADTTFAVNHQLVFQFFNAPNFFPDILNGAPPPTALIPVTASFGSGFNSDFGQPYTGLGLNFLADTLYTAGTTLQFQLSDTDANGVSAPGTGVPEPPSWLLLTGLVPLMYAGSRRHTPKGRWLHDRRSAQ